MVRCLFLFIFFSLLGCSGQSPQELVAEGDRLSAEGNLRGAIVLYKNALEKDTNDLSARLGLANAYLNSGTLDQAEREFQKIQLQNPSLIDVSLKLAVIYIEQGNSEKSLAEMAKFHSKSAETAESLTINGRAHAVSGDFSQAENLFNKAIGLDSDYAPAHLNLAKTYLQRNELARAERSLRATIVLDSRQFEAYYLLASLETGKGNTEAALQLYQDLIVVDAGHFYAYYMAGILQLDLGDFPAAEQTVALLQRRFADRPEGSRLAGMLLYRQGNYPDARISLEQSSRAEPHPLTFLFLGLTHYSQEQYEQALNQFQGALDISPQFDRARVLVALTLLKQNRIDDAITQAQRVVRENPSNAYARNILGSAYLASGQLDRGMAELEAATNLDPTMVEAHLKRGAVRLSQGDVRAGEEDLIRAVHIAPELLNSRLMLVTHYLRQKNYSAAIDSLKEGMNDTDQDALLHNYLAAAYFSQNKPELAVAALNAAKVSSPDYLTPYFNLAAYYASQSDYAQALVQYQEILTRDSENLRALLGMAAVYNVLGQDTELNSTFQKIEATRTEQGFVATAQYQIRKQDPAQALAVVERGLKLHGNSVSLFELQGGLYQQSGNYAAAEAAFTRLSVHSPERGSSQLWRLYMTQKDQDKAQKLVTDLLQSTPGQDYPYLLAAAMHMSRNDPDAAINILQQGISRLQIHSRLQLQLGAIFEQQQQNDRAEQLYQRIIQSDPGFAPAYVALGASGERRGNKGIARDHYQTALSHDPNNVIALNNLAYILADNFGEDRQALDYAMRAYQLRPNDPRIMDTLGYILVKNGRAQEALNLLLQAHELLPDIPVVAIHLAQAKIQLNDKDGARALLEQVRVNATPEDEALIRKLLGQL